MMRLEIDTQKDDGNTALHFVNAICGYYGLATKSQKAPDDNSYRVGAISTIKAIRRALDCDLKKAKRVWDEIKEAAY